MLSRLPQHIGRRVRGERVQLEEPRSVVASLGAVVPDDAHPEPDTECHSYEATLRRFPVPTPASNRGYRILIGASRVGTRTRSLRCVTSVSPSWGIPAVAVYLACSPCCRRSLHHRGQTIVQLLLR